MTLALRRGGDPHRNPAKRIHHHRRALRVPGLRERLRAFGRSLRERDVAHVRDRRLDDAGDPDPEQPSRVARRRLLCAPLRVTRDLECALKAGGVVAGVVEPPGGGPVRERVAPDQVAARELGRIEPEPLRGDRHRPLEREIDLRAAEAAVEPGRAAIGQHDAIPRGHVRHVVCPGERAVHAVERCRLRCAHVSAHVFDRVVAEREQLALRVEARLELRDARRGRRARGQVLEPVLCPAHRHAETPRSEPDQDDVGVHRRLDPERAARVARRDQPQLRPWQPERGSRHRVQRERPLEVGPRRQAPAPLVPVADHAVALNGRAAPPREPELLSHDEICTAQRRVDVAVGERAVVHARRALGVQHRLLGLVVDLDQLGCVLGHVSVVRHHDGQWLTCITSDLVRGGQILDAAVDAGGERPRHRGDVGPGQHADDSGQRERRRGVQPADASMRHERAEDRGVPDVRNWIDVVNEAALSAQQCLVLQTRKRATDPGLRGRR